MEKPIYDNYIFKNYIGFCGKVYKIIGLKYNNKTTYYTTKNDIQNLFIFILKTDIKDFMEIRKDIIEKPKRYHRSYVIDILKDIEQPFDIGDAVFKEIKSPIFHISYEYRIEGNMKINPNLKDLGFSKLFSSEKCFQEISMYLSNIAEKMELIEIGDKYKITQHGFGKCSFKSCKENY